jgi:Xaa-Pro dipeptidase
VNDELARLYPAHIRTVIERAGRALAAGGFDHLLIASGRLSYRFLDDMPNPYYVNPQFKAWVPLLRHPDCWIALTPGRRPVLVYCQPNDYWHETPAAPSGYWVEHFDVRVVSEPDEAARHLPDAAKSAIIGEPGSAIKGYAPNNPQAVIDSLHFQRSAKTAYELACMRAASRLAARAHRAAERAFRAGASEAEIHRGYCAAAGQNELELPYGNIVALNEHAAILHYQYQRADKPAQHHSFLIDAGAQCHGYAADVTRTHSAGDGEFQALIDAMDAAQRALCDQVRDGKSYPEIHLDTHARVAKILKEQDYVRMSPESMVESGVTGTFMPHGVGHPIGLQVHDVAGFMASEAGGFIERPKGHPYLRMTRVLKQDFVVTIEPGLYFIDSLLAELKATPHAAAVNWDRVERMRRFGGVRIEDNVRVTEGAPENLTRDAFAAIA